MKRTIHYRQGYKIVINNKFYEVSDGKMITHFGELRHKPTLQEEKNETKESYEQLSFNLG